MSPLQSHKILIAEQNQLEEEQCLNSQWAGFLPLCHPPSPPWHSAPRQPSPSWFSKSLPTCPPPPASHTLLSSKPPPFTQQHQREAGWNKHRDTKHSGTLRSSTKPKMSLSVERTRSFYRYYQARLFVTFHEPWSGIADRTVSGALEERASTIQVQQLLSLLKNSLLMVGLWSCLLYFGDNKSGITMAEWISCYINFLDLYILFPQSWTVDNVE